MFLLFQLKLSFRHILRNKVFSFINIFGLSIGLSTCLLLFLFINNELSYDSSVPDSERIFRINTTINENSTLATGLLCLHEAGMNEIPEVEATTFFQYLDKILVKVNNQSQYENDIVFTDDNFLSFWGIKQLSGDRLALSKPNSLLLSEHTARKHFGKQNPVGKNFQIDGVDYNISGVIENPKPNMHFKFNIVVSITFFLPSTL